jgi:DNA-binding HxlR family transcriptional regulator
MEDKKVYNCSVDATLSVIGGRWKSIILFYLLQNKVMRFNQMQKTIPGITQRMLTNQLRELEKDDVVLRKVYAQVPPKVEYSLTDYCKTLEPILVAMRLWGDHHINR